MRQKTPKYARTVKTFQFTHPGGVRPYPYISTTGDLAFQFTHPGGERLALRCTDVCNLCFNSRTREGCDNSYGYYPALASCFNSRTREGCDSRGTYYKPCEGRFNSRTREGCDFLRFILSSDNLEFQFTHPGGVRLKLSQGDHSCLYGFNSRTREGCDAKLSGWSLHQSCFNSRTREGCDRETCEAVCLFVAQFQFTHPGGVRLWDATNAYNTPLVSIHAPGRGATAYRWAFHQGYQVSIHAPGRGATQ